MAQPRQQSPSITNTPSTTSAPSNSENAASQTNSHFSRSEIVTLLVGKDKIPLRVHKDLLCAKSKFFKGCLEKEFSEAEKKTITLSGDDVQAVEAFLTWVYCGQCDFDLTEPVEQVASRYEYGDKILAEAYCNDILDAVRASLKRVRSWLRCGLSLRLHTAGLEKSQLASFAMKSVVYAMMTDYSWEVTENGAYVQEMKHWFGIPPLMEAFTNELLRYRKKPYKSPNEWAGCQFHNHKDGSKCSASDKSSK